MISVEVDLWEAYWLEHYKEKMLSTIAETLPQVDEFTFFKYLHCTKDPCSIASYIVYLWKIGFNSLAFKNLYAKYHVKEPNEWFSDNLYSQKH